MAYSDRMRELRTNIQTLANQAKTLYAEVEAAGDKATGEDRTKLNNLIDDGAKMRAELDRLTELEKLDQAANQPAAPKAVAAPSARGRKSWGQIIVESDQYKQAAAEAPRVISLGGKVRMDSVNVKAPLYGSSEATGGALIQPQRDPDLVNIPFRPRSVLDRITTTPVTSNVIEYTIMASRTNAATTVAEYTSGNFGLKPESGMTFELKSVNVRTIATWIPASRAILADVANLQSMVDMDLTQMLRVKLEDQIVSGDGTGENFVGILNTPNILTRTQGTGGRSLPTDKVADTIRRGLTDVRLEFYEPDGILLNPTDAEEMELQKDTTGQYVMVWDPTTGRAWRVDVYESPVIGANAGIIGAWALGARLWDRMQTEIRVGEPNDYFLRNAVALLAELRAAFAVVRPRAFCSLTFVDPS